MGIHDDKTSVMVIHDDKTSSSRKRPNRNFSIKQNNHKFTQLRNKDLSSSLDVDLSAEQLAVPGKKFRPQLLKH